MLLPYKWMLTSAVDVHGNTINYRYKYEKDDVSGTLYTSPITGARTRAVYPWQIEWGAGGDKLLTEFNVTARAIGGLDDISTNDTNSGVYQKYRINKIDVKRKQQSTSTYALLRSYELQHSYGITLTLDPDDGYPYYEHLTLTGIKPIGNDGTTQLPSTTFAYYNRDHSQSFASIWDMGHLYQAKNGYGGEVYFYYDRASGDIHNAYRRVRAKRVFDGMDPTHAQDTPHNVKYLYDYRGGMTNMTHVSADASLPQPIQSADTQFRGFAWVREQIPLDQETLTYQTIDHYYSQDDTFKSQEWRVQVGKTDTYADAFSTPTPNATVTSNLRWNVTGTIDAFTDPANSSNNTWKLRVGASMQRTATPTGTAQPAISAYLKDGSDVAMRYYITGVPEEADSSFAGTSKLVSGNNYWGVKIYRANIGGAWGTYAKLVWSISGVTGERDLSPSSSTLPRQKRSMDVANWQWVRLHTSPDGRFVAELYDDDHATIPANGRVYDLHSDYIMVKGGDGTIPLMPTGESWLFKQEVTAGDTSHSVLVDDYTETRTVYSQQDSVYTDQTHTQNTATSFVWE